MRLFLRQWQVAFRRKPQASILTDQATPFIVIPNTRRFSAADPFLFSENGETYLFAELYDKKEGRGKLGYAVYDGGAFSAWKVVISEPYHLSYPNVVKFKDQIYMIPEASESRTLYAYRAVCFPDRWEKCPPILTDRQLVDTTFLTLEGTHWMFTYDLDGGKLFLYRIDETGIVFAADGRCISEDDASARPGGNFFCQAESLIRVSQDCKEDYGAGLVFSRMNACDETTYAEQQVLRLYPKDIAIGKRFVSGLHTYNANEELEVIDFHMTDFDPMTQIRRIAEKVGLRK